MTGLLGGDDLKWRARLAAFALQGFQEDDVQHWIWILSAESTDVKADRLVSSPRFKPIFVLNAILRTDEYITKGSTLVKIYDYIARTYISVSLEARRAQKAERDHMMQSVAMDSIENMTTDHFKLVLKRLLYHAIKIFPSSLPMVARLVVDFLRGIGDWEPKRAKKGKVQLSGYATACLLFNFALDQFRRTAPVNPLANMPHNWKAQRILLGYSASREKPYIITRASYRAIRIVLLGLKKSEGEQLAASRYSKSWPPHIRQLDGTDETRDKTDYYSRSVQAGILKQSDGYSHDLVDHALDRVGGAQPGRSIFIQTRSPPDGLWRYRHHSRQIHSYWAAKVKATRDAYEAWQIFHQPPAAGIEPDFQVYAEMFSKLFAADVDPDSTCLPGDAKETYPPFLDNLTDVERERVTPCSPDELYDKMIQSGQKPVFQCLSVLIRNADSAEKASRYLNDSTLLEDAVHNMTASPTPQYQQLAQIPVPIFNSYIAFLCNIQGRKRWPASRSPDQVLPTEIRQRYSHLHHAIQLVCARLGPRRSSIPAAWYTIMTALAGKALVLQPTAHWAEDDLAALKTMIDLFHAHNMTQGVHPTPFDCLCRCILKLSRDKLGPLVITPQQPGDAPVPPPAPELYTRDWEVFLADARREIARAFDMARNTFAQLIAPVDVPADPRLADIAPEALPALYHELSASHVRTYLELLAKFGDVDESVRIMEWVLAPRSSLRDPNSDVFDKAREPGHKQWAMMREAFVCFRAFIEDSGVDPATLARIKARFQEIQAEGGTWTWPSEEDVLEYKQWQKENETWPVTRGGKGWDGPD